MSGRDFNVSVHAFAAKALNGETGFADYVNNGERRRVFYAPAGHDFFFIIFFPISVIEAMVRTPGAEPAVARASDASATCIWK